MTAVDTEIVSAAASHTYADYPLPPPIQIQPKSQQLKLIIIRSVVNNNDGQAVKKILIAYPPHIREDTPRLDLSDVQKSHLTPRYNPRASRVVMMQAEVELITIDHPHIHGGTPLLDLSDVQ